MKIFLLVLFIVAVVVLGPIATIWSLNTLFPALAIPVNFDTWCAAAVLGGILSAKIGK
jgi:hypothetical protein